MKIRGDISINGDGNPLVIIDGISGSLDELNAMNPNDIENVSVLKDASAAIYGARSAAGVVFIQRCCKPYDYWYSNTLYQ